MKMFIQCFVAWMALLVLGFVFVEFPFLLIPVWVAAGAVSFLLLFGIKPLRTKNGRYMMSAFMGTGFFTLLAAGFMVSIPNKVKKNIAA